ncbi:hypothetical protein J4E91_004069 [Alternaria rosae]|nr:hypothetical protein J4E91_004069 [Alternaria rosae]
MDHTTPQKKDIKPVTQPAKAARQLLLEDLSAIRADMKSLAQRFDHLERNIKATNIAGTDGRLTSFTKAIAARNRDGKWVRAEDAEELTKELREEEERMEDSVFYWFKDLKVWLNKGLANVEEAEKRSREHRDRVSKKIDAFMHEQE